MRGWRLLAIAALVAILLAAIAVGCWLADDRELSAFEIELAAAGADDRSPRPLPSTRDDAWWDALLADLPDVRSASRPYAMTGTPWTWQPASLGKPLPPAVASFQASIGDDVADLIVERVARMRGDDVPPRRVEERIRHLREFLVERILVAPRDRLSRLVDAAATAAGPSPVHATALVQAVGWRLDDCVAAHVAGAPLIEMAERMPAALLTRLRWSVARSLGACRAAADEPLYGPRRWMYRYARPALIRESRAWQALARADDVAGMIATLRAAPIGLSSTDRATIAHRVAEVSERYYLVERAFAVVGARALAALLDRRDLPNDPFAPSAAPVRRRARPDGSQIVYSVGVDGVDDGGDAHGDFPFAIVGASRP